MTDSSSWPAPNLGGNENPIASEPRAGFWLRFVAFICDNVNSLIVSIPASIVGNIIGGKDASNLFSWAASFLAVAYWTGSAGGSPLRRRLGVIVLDENDGSFIGFRRGAIRVMMSWVSGVCLLLGYLWMIWDRNSQTWHDKVAHTVVVRR